MHIRLDDPQVPFSCDSFLPLNTCCARACLSHHFSRWEWAFPGEPTGIGPSKDRNSSHSSLSGPSSLLQGSVNYGKEGALASTLFPPFSTTQSYSMLQAHHAMNPHHDPVGRYYHHPRSTDEGTKSQRSESTSKGWGPESPALEPNSEPPHYLVPTSPWTPSYFILTVQ